jgi:hypothetical protein
MRSIRALLAIITLAVVSSASAHLTAVNLDVLEQAGRLTLLAGSVEGYPINGARMEYILMNQQGATLRGGLKETADGEYTAPLPKAAPGEWTLIVRDTTFPGEALEAKATVKWPLTTPAKLILPPSKAGAPGTPLLLGLLAFPILVALGVLAWVLIRRPKPDSTEPAAPA